MSRHAAWLASALCLVFAGCRGHAPDMREVCARARAFGVVVHAGSRVTSDGVAPGPAVACEQSLAAQRPLAAALERMPGPLRPAHVEVHLDPLLEPPVPLRGVEVQRATGALLAGSAALPALAVEKGALGVWLHELAHVRAAGARPSAGIPKRLFAALEEGVADYLAATVGGSTRVGAHGLEQRELTAAPVLHASEWARLALPDAFEPHRFGWAFAAELHRSEPRAAALLEDSLIALASRAAWPDAANTPATALSELLRRCPARSRAALDAALSRWIPRELYRG
jgi:hypothetical protein